jgi:hypothetical protein
MDELVHLLRQSYTTNGFATIRYKSLAKQMILMFERDKDFRANPELASAFLFRSFAVIVHHISADTTGSAYSSAAEDVDEREYAGLGTAVAAAAAEIRQKKSRKS